VLDNLEMGAYLHGKGAKEDFDRVYELFPLLYDRRSQLAGTMSGGEQQMVAMGRALMGRPKLLLMDEPSMGLAPILVERNFEIIKQVHESGVAILVVEQNANVSLSIADRGYVLSTGRLVLELRAPEGGVSAVRPGAESPLSRLSAEERSSSTDRKDEQVVLRHGAVGLSGDAGVDAAEQLHPLLGGEGDVVREGAEDGDVGVGRVLELVEMSPLGDVLEEPGGFELRRVTLGLVGIERRPVVRVGNHGVVVLLYLRPEGLVARQAHVRAVDDRERAARPQQPHRLRVAQVRCDPVEGGERHDRVEVRLRRLPGLEVRADDLRLGDVAARDLRELGGELDAGDGVAALRQLRRRLACAGADLEQA
jgi:energy-coupling factor transporter ATP-binding protein EcfA2